jgi:hypothetical protein
MYQNWAEGDSFLSMLPKDAEKRRQDAKASGQSCLDPHLVEKPQKERVIPYTSDLFREAAIEWLVSTDQVMEHCALYLPGFTNQIAADSSA